MIICEYGSPGKYTKMMEVSKNGYKTLSSIGKYYGVWVCMVWYGNWLNKKWEPWLSCGPSQINNIILKLTGNEEKLI